MPPGAQRPPRSCASRQERPQRCRGRLRSARGYPHTATRRRCAGTARDINAMRTATSAAFVPLRERSHDSIITWPAAPAPKNPVCLGLRLSHWVPRGTRQVVPLKLAGNWPGQWPTRPPTTQVARTSSGTQTQPVAPQETGRGGGGVGWVARGMMGDSRQMTFADGAGHIVMSLLPDRPARGPGEGSGRLPADDGGRRQDALVQGREDADERRLPDTVRPERQLLSVCLGDHPQRRDPFGMYASPSRTLTVSALNI